MSPMRRWLSCAAIITLASVLTYAAYSNFGYQEVAITVFLAVSTFAIESIRGIISLAASRKHQARRFTDRLIYVAIRWDLARTLRTTVALTALASFAIDVVLHETGHRGLPLSNMLVALVLWSLKSPFFGVMIVLIFHASISSKASLCRDFALKLTALAVRKVFSGLVAALSSILPLADLGKDIVITLVDLVVREVISCCGQHIVIVRDIHIMVWTSITTDFASVHRRITEITMSQPWNRQCIIRRHSNIVDRARRASLDNAAAAWKQTVTSVLLSTPMVMAFCGRSIRASGRINALDSSVIVSVLLVAMQSFSNTEMGQYLIVKINAKKDVAAIQQLWSQPILGSEVPRMFIKALEIMYAVSFYLHQPAVLAVMFLWPVVSFVRFIRGVVIFTTRMLRAVLNIVRNTWKPVVSAINVFADMFCKKPTYAFRLYCLLMNVYITVPFTVLHCVRTIHRVVLRPIGRGVYAVFRFLAPAMAFVLLMILAVGELVSAPYRGQDVHLRQIDQDTGRMDKVAVDGVSPSQDAEHRKDFNDAEVKIKELSLELERVKAILRTCTDANEGLILQSNRQRLSAEVMQQQNTILLAKIEELNAEEQQRSNESVRTHMANLIRLDKQKRIVKQSQKQDIASLGHIRDDAAHAQELQIERTKRDQLNDELTTAKADLDESRLTLGRLQGESIEDKATIDDLRQQLKQEQDAHARELEIERTKREQLNDELKVGKADLDETRVTLGRLQGESTVDKTTLDDLRQQVKDEQSAHANTHSKLSNECEILRQEVSDANVEQKRILDDSRNTEARLQTEVDEARKEVKVCARRAAFLKVGQIILRALLESERDKHQGILVLERAEHQDKYAALLQQLNSMMAKHSTIVRRKDTEIEKLRRDREEADSVLRTLQAESKEAQLQTRTDSNVNASACKFHPNDHDSLPSTVNSSDDLFANKAGTLTVRSRRSCERRTADLGSVYSANTPLAASASGQISADSLPSTITDDERLFTREGGNVTVRFGHSYRRAPSSKCAIKTLSDFAQSAALGDDEYNRVSMITPDSLFASDSATLVIRVGRSKAIDVRESSEPSQQEAGEESETDSDKTLANSSLASDGSYVHKTGKGASSTAQALSDDSSDSDSGNESTRSDASASSDSGSSQSSTSVSISQVLPVSLVV